MNFNIYFRVIFLDNLYNIYLFRTNMEIWIEKHRPKSFEDIIGQEPIVRRIKSMVEKKEVPHLLFAGPAGTGKTTLALVISKQLYGSLWRENFLELNASDERGIDVVRNTIKDFARTKAIGDVPFKIIYLDECDSLTKEAQQALRRTMENYASVTRFLLSCNYSSKIIDPIQSRCTIFRFRNIEKEDVFEYIDRIAKKEELKISKDAKEILYENSHGDLRRLLNILQSCASVSNKIDDKLIYEIASEAHPKEIKKIIEHAIKGDFLKSKNMLLDIMLKHGLNGLDVIKQIQKEVFELNIDEKDKLKLIEKCGEIEFRMVEGSDEFIQLQALLAGFYLG